MKESPPSAAPSGVSVLARVRVGLQLPLVATTMFLSAVLLFAVQPLCARMVLPVLGGAPAVWTACMLFFQAALLGAYALAGAMSRLGNRAEASVLCLVVWGPVALLSVHSFFPTSTVAPSFPVAWIVGTLLISVGWPFCALATTSPLLQRWFSASGHPHASDPYFLYAASNAGSLAGLLAYPLLVEQLWALPFQRRVWTWMYLLVAVMLTVCAVAVARQRVPRAEAPVSPAGALHPPQLSRARRLRWLALSFVPSSLSLGLTSYLSTDVAAVPMLWIVPLALYLLTFIVAFGRRSRSIAVPANRLLPLALLPSLLFMTTDASAPLWFIVPLHLITFAALAFVCHAALAGDRPQATELNTFYLWLAAGGMLGGLFNSVVAPHVFNAIAEYPLAWAAALFLRGSAGDIRELLANRRLLLKPLGTGFAAALAFLAGRLLQLEPPIVLSLLAPAALLCLNVSRHRTRFAAAVTLILLAALMYTNPGAGRVIYANRTFFGVYRVSVDGPFVALLHGTTLHGRQRRDDLTPEPLTYYAREGPIGDLLEQRPPSVGQSVGVVGLGIGSLAAYARTGDRWTFYELDPAVERLARDERFFHHLSACGPACQVVIGDARLSLASARAVTHDVLILDAFSSDAIPLHLLTSEALGTYLARLSPAGVIAFHISNRHVDLRPILSALARAHGLTARARVDRRSDQEMGKTSSRWVVMSRHPEDLGAILQDGNWEPLLGDGTVAWTDNFSNILRALRWR